MAVYQGNSKKNGARTILRIPPAARPTGGAVLKPLDRTVGRDVLWGGPPYGSGPPTPRRDEDQSSQKSPMGAGPVPGSRDRRQELRQVRRLRAIAQQSALTSREG